MPHFALVFEANSIGLFMLQFNSQFSEVSLYVLHNIYKYFGYIQYPRTHAKFHLHLHFFYIFYNVILFCLYISVFYINFITLYALGGIIVCESSIMFWLVLYVLVGLPEWIYHKSHFNETYLSSTLST